MIMRPRNLSRAPLFLVLFLATLGHAAGEPKYLRVDDVKFESFLTAPPADGSAEQKAEIATILDWQAKRTADDVARCQAEAPADYFYFANVLGSWFDKDSLPVTAAFLKAASADANAISETAKAHWKRTRPFVTDSRI